MPIPTRSVPTRDPRKQPATVRRTVANLKPSSAAAQLTEETASKSTPSTPSTLPTRRQSLVRPSQLRVPSSVKPGGIPTSARTLGRGPTSTVKQDDIVKRQPGRPPSPKKTDMPPPPRPTRSSSLRQPPTLSAGTAVATRGHTRHRSQVVAPSTPMTPQTPSATATPKQRTHFNTYQQHLSPKKTAKPPTPTPSTPAVPDAASSLIPSSWPEIAALQTELLQLSLLHKSTWQQSIQCETDAEAQLRGKYDSVAKDYRVILDKEKESQRRFNGQALFYWLKNSREHNGQQGFAEQLQVLSQVAQEVYDIADDGRGRYTVAILEFEDWLHNVDGIKKTQLPHVGANESMIFIDPIECNWKEDINALVMRLELASRQLQSLDILGYGEVEHLESSALLRIAKNLDELLTLMVEELSSIRRIEANIVQSETRRVSQLAQHLIETQPRENPTSAVPRTGVWR
ncbi:hypothetical protein ASPCAL07317 [Aspergillus calidoustus]|uniref:Uncharacterized protein n=1 Tax=Aspergillus calidoustus TaxID=454130 RepID=A0A0U5G2J7_ASPCI|nr:hypothetical protein ASPCAL07317 [Aspergillus calidoustus]